jgi:RNA polymerase sigma factor (TIGR02999 family)
MGAVTQILSDIEQGNPSAADELLSLVYDELRRLAAAKLAHEKPGQTLQATALVHEAYLRLVGDASESEWNSRGHFFAAAAEAMRRILIERARQKKSIKAGRDLNRQTLADERIAAPFGQRPDDVLAVHEVLHELAKIDPQAAELVKLRFFVGFTIPDAAKVLGVSPRTADNIWTYARAWLFERLDDQGRG